MPLRWVCGGKCVQRVPCNVGGGEWNPDRRHKVPTGEAGWAIGEENWKFGGGT